MVNESLRFGFDYDRALLLDVTTSAQLILPIINTLFIHPSAIFLVSRRKAMRWDIRVGYMSTVLGLLLSDWILFGLRGHILSPFAGFHCGGPLCRDEALERSIVAVSIALCTACWMPCFTFLTLRMHQLVLRGSGSRWLLNTRAQIVVCSTLISIELLNIYGFIVFSVDSKNASSIVKSPELNWMAERGGIIFIYGDFGQPEQIKYEMIILGLTIATHAPVLIAFYVHSISNLKECRKTLISNQTLRMTNRMLEVFNSQLKGAVLHTLAPIVLFYITVAFDTTAFLADSAHAALRFGVTMLYVTTPLQFSLLFIAKTSAHRKLFLHFNTKSFAGKTVNSKGTNLRVPSSSADQYSSKSTRSSTHLLPMNPFPSNPKDTIDCPCEFDDDNFL